MNTTLLIKAGIKGGSAHKHKWTDEERDIVRREYNGHNSSSILIAAKLSYLAGERITPCGVKGQVQKLGIAQDKSPRWTPEEEETLKDMITQYAPITIAKKLHRSLNAVVVKSKRLHCSRRVRDGWFTKMEVCEICGVDHHKVQRWIDAGELEAKPHKDGSIPQKESGACWEISEENLVKFLRQNASELQGRNVDLFQIVNLLSGVLATGLER